ncbi:hypothetical protein C8F01DRAFT_1262974 [Mycena amicta]|nr:hypothetical protein C8F01DRAFT_1262974 [Mycena amicta]
MTATSETLGMPPQAFHDDIPAEIWMAILDLLLLDSHLTVHTLNRRFRDLARPFVFSRFHLRMHGPRAATKAYTPLTTHALGACLAFWGSEHVAPLVQTVVISDSNTAAAVAMVAGFMPRVQNCRRVEIRDTRYSVALMQSLASLPHLRTVQVEWSSAIKESESASYYGLPSRGRNTTDYGHWLSAIDRESLEMADLCVDSRLLASISAQSAFPNVKRLSLNLPTASLIPPGELWSAMTKFPATERLHISWSDMAIGRAMTSEQHVAASTVLGRLTHFHGTLSLLAALLEFSPKPDLRSVTTRFTPCTFSILRDCILLRPGDTRLLTRLEVSLSTITHDNLAVLATLLPNLRLLGIFAVKLGDHDTAQSSINRLDQLRNFFISGTQPLSLPLNIRKLAIHWRYTYLLRLPMLSLAELRSLRDRLTSTYPALSALWLGDYAHTAVYYWRDSESYEEVCYVMSEIWF